MNDLPYRKGVNAIVIDSDKNFLLVQKNSYSDTQWDFPGGGLDEGESLEAAVLRELKEELGSDSFEILKQSPILLQYDWTQEFRDAGFKKSGIWWRGQEKHQFIVKFTGNKDSIVLQQDELKRIKWVPYADLEQYLTFEGQWENVRKVIEDAGLNQLT